MIEAKFENGKLYVFFVLLLFLEKRILVKYNITTRYVFDKLKILLKYTYKQFLITLESICSISNLPWNDLGFEDMYLEKNFERGFFASGEVWGFLGGERGLWGGGGGSEGGLRDVDAWGLQ